MPELLLKGDGLGTGVKASALPQQADQPTRSTNRLLGADSVAKVS
jgi:hypothetical protein